MKILYSWLSDFIENPPAPADLAAKLARVGLKVEEIRRPARPSPASAWGR